MVARQLLRVFIDFFLKESTQDEFHTFLFLWVKQRKDLLYLCCRKLKIVSKPTCKTRKVLEMLDLGFIQEAEVH